MENELFLILLFKESSVHNIREFFKQQRIRDCMRYFLVTLTIVQFDVPLILKETKLSRVLLSPLLGQT